jgi:hypothetical protein
VEVDNLLPNRIISDIGSGWGWFRPIEKVQFRMAAPLILLEKLMNLHLGP